MKKFLTSELVGVHFKPGVFKLWSVGHSGAAGCSFGMVIDTNTLI